MATADTKQRLFSRQYCGQLITKVVKIDNVVQQFINSKTLSAAETSALRNDKVADKKFRQLLTIITDHCNRKDLKAFKTFIDVLEDTGNIDVASQLSMIYKERVNHVATLSRLSKKKSLVVNLKKELSRLESTLQEKKSYFKRLRYEKKKLVDQYRKEADDQKNAFRKLSLENQIKKKEEDLLFVEKEMEGLTRKRNDLENEVELKSNVIRERDKEIVEKEREVWEAIEESNRLRLKIDTLQQQHSEDKEMSRKIEILEDELAEKENTIMNLRKNKTMRREEIEEELGNITKVQERKLDFLTTMMRQQTEQVKQDNDDMKDTLKMMLSLLKKN